MRIPPSGPSPVISAKLPSQGTAQASGPALLGPQREELERVPAGAKNKEGSTTSYPPERAAGLWPGAGAEGRRAAKLSIDQGATTLTDRKMFEQLSHRDNRPGSMGIREVKFLIVDADGPSPQLYFINTGNIGYHFDFARNALGSTDSLEAFDRNTYGPFARKNIAGSLLAHDDYESPSGERGMYTLEFWPADPVSSGRVGLAYQLIKRAMPFVGDKLSYHPSSDIQESLYAEQKEALEKQGLQTVSTDTLFRSVTFQPMNPGVGFGTLRLIDGTAGRPPSARDVVIFKTLPNDLPHVAGVLTEGPQTPLSHVNLKAKQNNTPNAYVRNASTDPRIQPLLDKVVRYEVGPDGFELREATADELEAYLEKVRPKDSHVPARDLSARTVRSLRTLRNADSIRFGAKAANLGELERILPDATPDGVALPFSFYDDFMKANGLYAEAQAMMADPAFKLDPAVREAKLTAFRRKVRNTPVPPALAKKINDVQLRFPPGTNLRCRSSTNNEDLEGFNGAGLYDSYTHRTDEGLLENTVKQVWSSLWTYRAFEERDFYRIDHLAAAMGVAIHPNFDDERTNGVAVTKNIYDPNFRGFYVNVQAGESLVTNPDPSAIPDEMLIATTGLGGEYQRQFIRRSSLSPDGKPLLSDEQTDMLVAAMEKIQKHFAQVYGRTGDAKFAMDIEFKFDSLGRLVVKQARPWVD